MKVLLHTKDKSDLSYLLVFKKETITKNQLRQIVDTGGTQATHLLFMRSSHNVKISPKELKRAKFVADFVVGQRGYTAERLA